MNEEELDKLMESRGYSRFMIIKEGEKNKSIVYSRMESPTAPFVKCYVGSKNFEMYYDTNRGALHLTTRETSPIDNDKQYLKFSNFMAHAINGLKLVGMS